jgi:uncharacterized protein Yka (UPF0111/DUF47 family)
MDKVMDNLANMLNNAFGHVYHKLDDIEQRLTKLESRVDTMQNDVTNIQSKVHIVRNDTRLIRPMFELTRMGSAEIGELQYRVKTLEKQS